MVKVWSGFLKTQSPTFKFCFSQLSVNWNFASSFFSNLLLGVRHGTTDPVGILASSVMVMENLCHSTQCPLGRHEKEQKNIKSGCWLCFGSTTYNLQVAWPTSKVCVVLESLDWNVKVAKLWGTWVEEAHFKKGRFQLYGRNCSTAWV